MNKYLTSKDQNTRTKREKTEIKKENKLHAVDFRLEKFKEENRQNNVVS